MAEGTQMPPQLLRFWLDGRGAAEIQWGHAGDYERCISAIQAKVTEHGEKPLGEHVIHGLCATLHKLATGAAPGHAAGEQHG